ncbi:MAG: phage late control D family protein [Dialister sp.]|jgi:phage protein D
MSVVNSLRKNAVTQQTGYARRAYPKVIYNKVDISEALKPYLKSMEYTDMLTGQADDLQLTLEDRDGLWLEAWFPDKGATLTASILTQYWTAPTEAEKELPLGLFEIDEIECSAIPSETKIKAVSVPNNTTLRGEGRTRSWEGYTIQKIAQDIANNAGMQLNFSSKDNPTLERVEQTEQSDLAFLDKLCQDNGLSLKVTDNQIVIFDMADMEAAEPSLIFVRPTMKGLDTSVSIDVNSNDMNSESTLKRLKPTSWRFTSSVRDVYKSCTVEHSQGKKKAKISATFTDPNKTEGKMLLVKKDVKSVEEAERMARKELREKNKDEVTGSITCMGDTDLSAGLTVTVKGFGKFDGKYILSQVKHSLGSGYTCSVDLRRCLNGY